MFFLARGDEMGWRQLFFSGKGRVGRRDFWIADFLIVVIAAPLRLLGWPGNLLAWVLLFPHVCLLSKRLHDRGWSGWFAGVPFIGSLIAGMLAGSAPDDGQGPTGPLAWVAAGVNVAAVVFFFRVGLARGHADANRYGEPQVSFLGRADQEAGRLA